MTDRARCQVYQFVPSISISRQVAIILLTILQLIQVVVHPSKDLELCMIALCFCSPVRNTVPRIFEHVLPCRRTTRRSLREVFHRGNFSVAPAEIRDSNFFLYSSIMISFGFIHVECIPNIRGREMKLTFCARTFSRTVVSSRLGRVSATAALMPQIGLCAKKTLHSRACHLSRCMPKS